MEKTFNSYRSKALFTSIIMGVLVVYLLIKGLIVFAMGTILVWISILSNFEKKFGDAYKEEIVRRVLFSIVDEFTYKRRRGFLKDDIYGTQMVMAGNKYHSEDYIKGVYKGIDFELADVFVNDRRRRGKRVVDVEIFKGQWVRVNVDKVSPSSILVLNNHLTGMYSNRFVEEVLERVYMESVSFNNIYKVYSLRAHDAFYILTPDIIEKLVRLKDKKVSLYRSGTSLQLAIYSSVDLVKPSLLSGSNLSEELYRYEMEMKNVFSVMDMLLVRNSVYKPIARYRGS